MSLRSLTLLVLAVLIGTATSVRWYLQADEEPAAVPEALAPAPLREHVPLRMWAEPARQPASKASTQGRSGVALRGQVVPAEAQPASEEPRPAASDAAPGVFRPLPDPL